MEYIEKIKKLLCKELDEYAMKNKLTMADLEAVHKLTDTVKNLDKIAMLEEESEGYSETRSGTRRGYGRRDMSYNDDMSYARGRGKNAKRDSMGRYSSNNGYSDEDDFYVKGGQGGDRNYSRDDAKDHLMRKLGGMMEDADPNERKILKDAMRKIEDM